ncbi:MAG: hypothetical protein FIA97_09070, partial [Methylococcaceae bacterium]|nr:hypothetical protein [Methylococcaceae bacterium]
PADGAHFDAVMAYYTIDQAQQFLQNSGADAALQRSIRVNVNGSDGNHPYYVPGDDFIMLSSGGVDAGEDAETILHEYFHAVQERLKPGVWGGASNPGVCAGTQALAEGYSDFFAALLTAQKPPYRYLIGEWSATTSDLPKRDLRTHFPYPQQTGADEYRNGSLWAGALLEVERLNGYSMNPVWLDAMSLTEPGFTFSDAASAVLTAADRRHLPSKYQPALLRALTSRGFIGSDLEVRLTLPDEPVKVGPEFSYPVTVTVANHGPEAAAAVTLTGAIGKPAELVSAPANCRADGNVFSCDLSGLAVGSETSVQLTVSGAKLGTARITADAALKSYGNSWVATQHLALLDPIPLNNRSRVALPIVDWCADISGAWNYATSFRLYCTIPEGVVVNQPINDSGLIDIAQNGCRFHWNAGGGMKRRGRMHRNRFSFGGILVKSVASNASIQFYNNNLSVHGTYTGDRIDRLKAQATVNGHGCLGSQCRDFTCSTPGGISMSFTRAD